MGSWDWLGNVWDGVKDFAGSEGGGAVLGAAAGALLNDSQGGTESSTTSTSQAPSYLMPYLTDNNTGVYPLSRATYLKNMDEGYIGRNADQQAIDMQTTGQLGQWNNSGYWQDMMNQNRDFANTYSTPYNPSAMTSAPNTIGDFAVADPRAAQFSQNAPTINAPTVGGIGEVERIVAPNAIDSFAVNSNMARQGMGSLDPTGALQTALGGQVDTNSLDALQNAVNNRAMIGYGDAVDDAATMYNQQIAPQIRSRSILDGGYGGSRQGIAEGVAAGELNKQLARNARDLGTASMDVGTQLYGNAYDQAKQRQYGAATGLNNQAVNTATNNANRAYGAAGQNVGNQMAGQQFNANIDYQNRLSNAGILSNDANRIFGANTQNAMNTLQNSQFNSNMDYRNIAQQLGNATNNANRAYGAAGQNVGNQMAGQQFNANLNLANNTQQGQINQQNANLVGQGQGLYTGNMNSYLQAQQALSGLAGLGNQDQRNQQAFDWGQLNNYLSAIQGDRGMTTSTNTQQPGNLLSSMGYGMTIGQGVGSYFGGNPSTVQAPTQANDLYGYNGSWGGR